MAIGSIKRVKSSYRELRRTFSERRLQERASQSADNKEGLLDRETQDTNTIDDLDSASVTQSSITCPDVNNATSPNKHDPNNSDGIAGHSTYEVEAAVQRTRRRIFNLDANIDEPEAASCLALGPDTDITAKPDTPTINSEALSTTSGALGKKPCSKEYWLSQPKHPQTPKHTGWEQLPGRYDEKEPVPRDSKMESETPGQQPNDDSRTTSSNIPHCVPLITLKDYSSCFNEIKKPQNTRRKLFETKLSYLKMEFPEYAPMFIHPAFREGFDIGTETSPNAGNMEDNKKRDRKTFNLAAQVINLTIESEQFNTNVTDPAPEKFLHPLSHRSIKRPRSSIHNNGSLPSCGIPSSAKVGKVSQFFGTDFLASAKQPQPNRGNESSQAETLVSEVTERDVIKIKEDTEAQAAISGALETAHTSNDDERRIFTI
jgi:hypothetical protein